MNTIDVSKGECIGTVSQQWANRPDDQKFLSLADLRTQVAQWADESYVSAVKPREMQAVYDPADPLSLSVMVGDAKVAPTNFAFKQICSIAKAPADYLATLPGALAAVNLNYGLNKVPQKEMGAYLRADSVSHADLVRGVTSLKYGRIFDRDVVDAVMKIAGNGTGDTHWKVPGTIDWSSRFGVTYNPNVDITKDTTTLYASDRDVFLFLVDDLHPICVGKLKNGDDDLMFRGFYVWNSEVGQRSFGISTMYLRGVCQNRNLWGVEGFNEFTFRHTSGAPEKFALEAGPMLEQFSDKGSAHLIKGVKAAKKVILAQTGTERNEFLRKLGLSDKQAIAVLLNAQEEEGEPPSSAWDFAQALTAYARRAEHQDKRLHLEIMAGRVLDKVTVEA
jgi:hypothetical protein